MRLRIHFTRDDLLRIRLADAPDPMWEIVNSLHLLQSGGGGLVFDRWRRGSARRLDGGEATRRAWRMLVLLAPCASYFPDFLTPAGGHRELDAAVDSVLSTPADRLGREMGRLASGGRPQPWFAALARGDAAVMGVLGEALRTYHRGAIEPHRSAIQAAVRADIAARTRALLYGGGEALLDSLSPLMRWSTPVLEMDYPVDRDLYLDGRGLRLVPSFFCWRHPVSYADPGLPPTVVYPVGPAPGWTDPDAQGGASGGLAALVGPTRAWILELVAERPATTTDLARAAGVSPATVSKHAAVLRGAGLICSHSEGRHVLHTATAVGMTLLAQR
ncbi:hypothetical protein HNR23_001344 [Nocardiopsis mwathae]|uniref:HTH arsR-type domain-containing protein n=1 Tax=Nocardiopsis mwathae TaxID=1472723 RepID=A0A7W9YFT2_9ACTN|nr:winged helix-turn-helix domain-containing protein [Nocardiopsis mwathae]MBB6171284.1 hypothetical protein [Nocardiopsis mwathae]